MIRTRDLLILLLVLVLLSLVILVTTSGKRLGGDNLAGLSYQDNDFVESRSDTKPQAFWEEATPDYDQRLALWREKIKRYPDIGKVLEDDDIVMATAAVKDVAINSEDEVIENSETGVSLCVNYHPADIYWPYSNVTVTHDGNKVSYGSELGLLLEINKRSISAGGKQCLGQDVVGVALDGSLIRNGEYGLYGVFGESTQIGYALDGYPIYGLNNSQPTDACGGATVDGSYRYYLSSSRPGVLGCFTATPVTLY